MRTGSATLCTFAVLGACYEGEPSVAANDSDGTEASTTDEGEGEGESSTGDPEETPASEVDEIVAAAPLRRLTRWELDNTIRDLVGDDTRPAERHLPADLVPGGFDTLAAGQHVSLLVVDAYMRLAEDVAARADVDALVPCDATDDACPQQFVESFVGRAYRRPLTDADVDPLLAIFAEGDDFDDGVRRVIEAVLQSPHFLYRPELGGAASPADAIVALTDHEIATRLSYFLWGSMPDHALREAADAGELATVEGLTAHAERLLEDPRARELIAHFARQWLDLAALPTTTKDATLYPAFDAELAAAMEKETLAFVEHVVFDGEGDLTTLLTADYTLADASIAALYGIDDGRGAAFEPLTLDRRAGVLTHPSVLSVQAQPDRGSPARRGRFVLSQLMCSDPQSLEPPPDVDTSLPADPDASTRERLERHVADPRCAACHALLDPIGFAFEHYDGIGRWRDDDDGLPIDASGVLAGDDDAAFDGAVELAARIAEQPQTQRCFVDRTFAFALARPPDEDAEPCAIEGVREAFTRSSGDVQSLVLAIVKSDAFRHRPVAH